MFAIVLSGLLNCKIQNERTDKSVPVLLDMTVGSFVPLDTYDLHST